MADGNSVYLILHMPPGYGGETVYLILHMPPGYGGETVYLHMSPGYGGETAPNSACAIYIPRV